MWVSVFLPGYQRLGLHSRTRVKSPGFSGPPQSDCNLGLGINDHFYEMTKWTLGFCLGVEVG